MAQSNGNTSSPVKKRCRTWFLTWNNPIFGWKELLAQFFETNEMEYIFQLERAETIHVQGVCRFKNARYNWPNIHEAIHWERCNRWANAKKYCCKLETRIEGPWTNIQGLKFRETVKDPLEGKTLHSFQKQVLQLVHEDPDDRTINWYYDYGGCTGKTALAKHIALRYGKECVLCMGTARDVFKLISDRLEDNIDPKVVIFLLTRADGNRKLSWRAIEGIKDGLCVSTKYEPIDLIFNPPHVFVFANFPPDMSNLSADRWNIVEIATS